MTDVHPAMILWAAMTDAVAVQLITSVTTIGAIVVTWLTQRRRRHSLRKNRKIPPQTQLRLWVLLVAVGVALVVTIPPVVIAWRSGALAARLQGMTMVWTALLGIVVQVAAILVLLRCGRALGSYSKAIDDQTETLMVALHENMAFFERNKQKEAELRILQDILKREESA